MLYFVVFDIGSRFIIPKKIDPKLVPIAKLWPLGPYTPDEIISPSYKAILYMLVTLSALIEIILM